MDWCSWPSPATPTATLRQIGDAVGITGRATQRLVPDLVDAGYGQGSERS